MNDDWSQYYWPEPNGDGWIDAWNGWYDNESDAADAAMAGLDGAGSPVLNYGEGLINEVEFEKRRNETKVSDWIAGAAPADETWLRGQLVDKWGPAGAHVDVFDTVVKHDRNTNKLLVEAVALINGGIFPGKGKKRDAFLAKVAEFTANPFMEV